MRPAEIGEEQGSQPMRDYAEIGREKLRGGHRAKRHESRLEELWSALGSSSATLALELLLVALLVLESVSPGNGLPEADPSRLGPTALRIVLMVLGVQLVIRFLYRLLPAMWSRRAASEELEIESAMEARMVLPPLEEDPPLTAWLEAEGGHARASGRRRAFGVRGRLALWGVPLVHLGLWLVLWGFAWTLEEPAAARLKVSPGETVEVLEVGKSALFTGATFTLEASEGFEGLLPGVDGGRAPQLVVRDASRGEERTLDLEARRSQALPDGSQVRLRSVRWVPDAGVARVRVNGDMREVRAGETLAVGGESYGVSGMSLSYKKVMGPALRLEKASGETVWVFEGQPGLAEAWGIPRGLELVSVQPQFELELERYAAQEPLPFALGLGLMLLGGGLLLSQRQISMEVVDEVDRLVVKGSSTNDVVSVVTHALGGVLERAEALKPSSTGEEA